MVSCIFEIIDDLMIEPRLSVPERLHGGVHDVEGAYTHQGTSATLISSAVFFAPAPASMRAAGDRMLSPASDSAHTAVLGRHVALSPRPDSAGRRFDALGLAWKALPGERVNAQTSRFPRLRERPTQGERVAKESGAVRKWQRARGRDAERKGEPNSHAALEPRRRLPRTPRRRPSTPRRRLQVDGAG